MMQISVLGSGSRGNAYTITHAGKTIMVDAGFSFRQIRRRLAAVGQSIERVEAIFVTHEHTDHIRGIPMIRKHCSVDVFASPGTIAAMGNRHIRTDGIHPVTGPVSINGMMIHPFSVPHDAADPLGFVVEGDNGNRAGIATDMGVLTHSTCDALAGVHTLVLESNHDQQMLIHGPYPWDVKQRIRGRTGHLSNQQVKEGLPRLLSSRLRNLLLAHLSEQNNCPDKAFSSAKEALITSAASHVRIIVAEQHSVLPPMEV